jgi:hypothetical protein
MRKASVISARCPLSSTRIPSQTLTTAPHKKTISFVVIEYDLLLSIIDIKQDAIVLPTSYES